MNATETTALVKAVKDAVMPEIDKVNQAVNQLREKGGTFTAPAVSVGGIGRHSQPYSVAKMAAKSMNFMADDQCKYEIETSERLKSLYGFGKSTGFRFHGGSAQSWLVPYNTEQIEAVAEHSANDAVISATQEMILRVKSYKASAVDPDEIAWHRARQNGALREKAANTLSDTDGGVLRGFPTLGDIIEIQRNLEVFSQAGCTHVTLPPNGMLTLPKQTGNTTAYYEGEGNAITSESQIKVGTLDLVAKKMYVRTTITNDAMRFITPSIEAMTRTDMAAQAALVKDLKMIEGASGTKAPRGILTYKQPGSALTRWSQGNDYLIEYTGTGYDGANGSYFNPEDLYLMTSKLPDIVQKSGKLKFIGRFDMYAALANRRGDAVTVGDSKGPFVFNMMRDINNTSAMNINGSPFIASSQISATRGVANTPNTASTMTFLLAGDFSSWVDASFGVAEFLATNVSDAAFDNDTTKLRMIAYNDAGPRHASAFVLYDNLRIA